MGFVQRRLVKLVMRVVSAPRMTLVICAVMLAASVAWAWLGLKLSTNQDELIAPQLKFFRDYQDYARRFPENESFVVIIEPLDYAHPPPTARWRALADRITEALLAMKGDVKWVNARTDPALLGEFGLMFDSRYEVESESAAVKGLVQLINVLLHPSMLESVALGDNLTQRFFNAVAAGGGGAKDSKDFVAVIARSLAAALRRDPTEWQAGIEIPDLTQVDPRAATDPRMYGYNMIPDETKRADPGDRAGWERYQRERIMAINVFGQRDYSSLADVTEPLKRMRAVVETIGRDFPEFKKPIITGRLALEADEMATSDNDTTIAEICGLSLVFVVLLIFLRNLWLVVVAEITLCVGIGWTFGWATISVGRLNLLSLVFVIALIGIGMDYLIQILTRYRFEKKRYGRAQAIWARVFRYVSPPISTACAGAAGAFIVAVFTGFQGAAELGVIAGGGLLLCLLAGYTVLPALLTVFPAKVGKLSEDRRYQPRVNVPRAGGWRLVPAIVWVGVSAVGLLVALPPRFDPNLLKLQADGLESVQAVRKLPAWSAVVMCVDLEELRRLRAAFLPKVDDPVIRSTESLEDALENRQWLLANNEAVKKIQWPDVAGIPAPSEKEMKAIGDAARGMIAGWEKQPDAGDLKDVKGQVAAVQAAIEDGRVDMATKIARIAQWQKALVGVLRADAAQFYPGELDVRKLPRDLRGHLVSFGDGNGEADGGNIPADAKPVYALYIYPREDLWEMGALETFVKTVESRAPAGVIVTGIAPQLYQSTVEIRQAFVNSTIYALILIFVLVLLDLRNIGQTLLAISVLALGLPMLLLMMWIWREWLHDPFGIPGTWNFANFFGLPILIGAGHEYGVFLVHRYRETLHDPRRVWRAWDVSDRALLLCGIVTSASFGFLVGAKHHGLASLGWVMAMGTLCIYLASLLVLRPILQWRLKRKGVYSEASALESSSR